MVTPSPATPVASATATPGVSEQNGTPTPGSNPPAQSPAAGNQGASVTITAEQHRQFLRDQARVKSFDRRTVIGRQRAAIAPANTAADPNDELARMQQERDEANDRAMQGEVREKVRDLFARPEYKDIPESMKKLILEKPHMLSDAETLDEAMLDIEDKLLEFAGTPSQTVVTTPIVPTAPSRETPPVTAPGAPAPVDAGVMEDVTNLRGPARSQAIMRNAMRKQKTGGK